MNITRLRRLLTATLLTAVVSTALTGCESREQRAKREGWLDNTPLPLDPTDNIQIGPWWSNGQQLLNLSPNQAYTLFSQNNRYSKPLERGWWAQQSFAFLLLDPYVKLQRGPTRVNITKVDGRVALMVPTFEPMFALPNGPPTTREDNLIGQWQGPVGQLRLNADLTYEFTPAPGAVAATDARIIPGHDGRWSLSGDMLNLTPIIPGVGTLVLTVRTPIPAVGSEDGAASQPAVEHTLEGLGGQLVKVKAATA